MTPGELIRRTEAKRKRVLFKQGGYAARTMRNSMRYTSKPDKHSAPEKPPLAHKGHKNPSRDALVRRLIKFRVDLSAGSVVAGPEKTGASNVPEVLDKGGRVKLAKLKKVEYEIGEYGPIRKKTGKGFHRVLLKTPGQTERAARLVMEENATRQSVGAYIKPRPFTVPVYTDGGENFRKLISREPL